MASTGIWSNFAKRSQSLAIKNKLIKESVLSPSLPHGPASLKSRASKIKYSSPIGMDKIYPLAYEILQKNSENLYNEIKSIDSAIESSKNDSVKLQELKNKKNELLVSAEENNPEVVYNSLYSTNSLDRSQPVYRKILEDKWKSYSRMLTMQRIESLAVIPDTLPTLEPEVDVKLRFPHNNIETSVELGTVLSSNVTSKPPALEIVEFKEVENELYTVLIVDPDTPHLAVDGYSTTLHWGLKDVPLSNLDYTIDAKKLMKHPDSEFVEYLAPTPEKNTGKHRLAVWVFRQKDSQPLKEAPKDLRREFFNIREFVEKNELQPIGAHVWRSIWDRNTEKVRELYGLPKGRIFTRERL
ncbi:unnamed protein product [[Candida] boidinii]|uniref:Unnamed protein product n=1 Tax=Candida boidinii TaxID=5477 RepID=A0ACB5TKA5_CANBO|nr:unnamed protein product [[Candida] boidinii]